MPGSAQSIVTDWFRQADVLIGGERPWDIVVRDSRFFARVLAEGALGLGESYMDGDWECEAIDEMSYRALRAGLEQKAALTWSERWGVLAARVKNRQTKARTQRAVSSHYDIGNDLFRAMLDPTMQYSCAYFAGTDDLAEAQRKKLDLICRKLGLRAGMRLLDIGCGWGGLARFAAERYGCRVVGITLSKQQAAYAQQVCVGWPIEIRLQDYRDHNERFDAVVSVGMMEHVGYKNYRVYLETAARCLEPGGLFLCHSIGGNVARVRTDPWLDRYIFPDSLLPSVSQVAAAAEGLFVIEDVHNFGAYYDLTLMAWARDFQAAWERDGLRPRYGERFGRMWRYYLRSCAGAFRARHMQLFQFVLSKGGVPGGYVSVR
jgi:cyclopropane-fatty-acyl-phospholipid synthase